MSTPTVITANTEPSMSLPVLVVACPSTCVKSELLTVISVVDSATAPFTSVVLTVTEWSPLFKSAVFSGAELLLLALLISLPSTNTSVLTGLLETVGCCTVTVPESGGGVPPSAVGGTFGTTITGGGEVVGGVTGVVGGVTGVVGGGGGVVVGGGVTGVVGGGVTGVGATPTAV